jgi:hypothetical protein
VPVTRPNFSHLSGCEAAKQSQTTSTLSFIVGLPLENVDQLVIAVIVCEAGRLNLSTFERMKRVKDWFRLRKTGR